MTSWQAAPVRASAAPLPVVASAPVVPANATASVHAPESAALHAHPFAELLRQRRDDVAAPVVAHERTLPISRDQNASASDETSEPPSVPSPPAKARPRAATPAASKPAAAAPSADDAAEPVDDGNDAGARAHEARAPGGAAAGDARAASWIAQAVAHDGSLAATNEGGDARRAVAAVAGDADADAQADLAATGTRAHGGRADARSSAVAEANDVRLAARAAADSSDLDPRARAPMLAAAQAEATGPREAVLHRPASESPVDALAPTLAAGAASATGEAPGAAAPAALSLPTPIDSADFGAAFGVQVSVLAKDGVQQAELHLNPAETGPVSVQIVLDGSEARIDFGADFAATRAAIERSLPELAAALRDAGLTLTGGGVSQHAGGRAGGDDDASRSTTRLEGTGHPASAPIATAPRRVARTVVAGGIDLYA